MPPKIRVNLSEIPDYVSVDAGRHRAKVLEVTEENSRSSGEPMWTWLWEVIGGDSEGRNIKSYTSLQEHALGGLKMHAKAFGYDVEKDEDVTFDSGKVIGKIAILVVTKRKVRSRETGEEIDLSSVSNVMPDADAKGKRGATTSPVKATESDKGPDDIPF